MQRVDGGEKGVKPARESRFDATIATSAAVERERGLKTHPHSFWSSPSPRSTTACAPSESSRRDSFLPTQLYLP